MSLAYLSHYFTDKVTFVSIDVGIVNLGLVWGHCDLDYQNIYFDKFKLIDLTKVIPKKKSGKQGYNHLMDKLKEIFGIKKELSIFKDINMIFVEYQPPNGLRLIQEFFVFFFKDKVYFVHPQKMHKFFRIEKLKYEERKMATIKLSIEYMNLNFFSEFWELKRQHDISDAMCLAICYISQNKKK